MNNFQYLTKVLRSCKTLDQIESFSNWKKYISLDNETWNNFNLMLTLRQMELDQAKYIERLKGINNEYTNC